MKLFLKKAYFKINICSNVVVMYLYTIFFISVKCNKHFKLLQEY